MDAADWNEWMMIENVSLLVSSVEAESTLLGNTRLRITAKPSCGGNPSVTFTAPEHRAKSYFVGRKIDVKISLGGK